MSTRQLGLFALAILLSAPLASAADKPAPNSTSLYGVPSEESIAAATKLIKQTSAQDYAAATSLPLRTALAQRLLKEAIETRDDTPARYVLLCESRDLAARAADAPTACRAI